MPTTATYAVSGMSCQHCVNAVTDEVTKVAGVTAVQVDLAAGTVAVTSEAPLDPELVRAAVDEAGYELAPPED
jgi:copper ion binding protein